MAAILLRSITISKSIGLRILRPCYFNYLILVYYVMRFRH